MTMSYLSENTAINLLSILPPNTSPIMCAMCLLRQIVSVIVLLPRQNKILFVPFQPIEGRSLKKKERKEFHFV